MDWDFEVLRHYQKQQAVAEPAAETTEPLAKPEDGAYCYGWFVEGANWDSHDMYLVESNPKEVRWCFGFREVV